MFVIIANTTLSQRKAYWSTERKGFVVGRRDKATNYRTEKDATAALRTEDLQTIAQIHSL